MTIQFPVMMPAGGEAAASGASVEAPIEGFAAMIDALIASLTEEGAAGAAAGPGAELLDENTAAEEIDAVLDAVGLVAEFGLIPDAVPVTDQSVPLIAQSAPVTSQSAAVVVSIGPATGPGAALPGCGCCTGQAAAVVESDATPVQAVPDSGGVGFESVATGTTAESAVPAARTAAPSMLTTQIVERVVELVQRQQAVTPPSTMVIELPEMVGARIAVTMHSSGVHLAFTGLGSSDLNPLIPQLQSGLAAAGMNLAGWSADPDGGTADGGAPDGGDRERGNGDGDDAPSFADYLGA